MARGPIVVELPGGAAPIARPLLGQRLDHGLVLRLLHEPERGLDDLSLDLWIVRRARGVTERIVQERGTRRVGRRSD